MSSLWKARLLPASFRGVPFKVLSHEHSGGRNTKRHEIPDSDDGVNEDLGKKTDAFVIEAHVIGDNYFFLRDALIDAMKTKDNGVLIHPYFGVKNVLPEGYSVREDTKQGRIAFFTLTFAEAGNNIFPFSQIDNIVSFANTAVVAIEQIKAGFELGYSVSNLPAFVLESAVSNFEDLVDTFRSIFTNVRLDPNEHASLTKEVDDFENSISSIASDPEQIADSIDGIIEGFKNLVPDVPDSFTIDSASGRDDKLAVFNDLIVWDNGADELTENTPSRTAEKNNSKAIRDLVQQLSLVRLSENTVNKSFKSIDEAENQRSAIVDNIDIQLKKENMADETFQALEDLIAKLVLAVPDGKSGLSNIKTIDQKNEIPSIVLAYDLYESIDNEQDIIDRNGIREPGFVVGDLEVLSI